jgi:hypothetical protein
VTVSDAIGNLPIPLKWPDGKRMSLNARTAYALALWDACTVAETPERIPQKAYTWTPK